MSRGLIIVHKHGIFAHKRDFRHKQSLNQYINMVLLSSFLYYETSCCRFFIYCAKLSRMVRNLICKDQYITCISNGSTGNLLICPCVFVCYSLYSQKPYVSISSQLSRVLFIGMEFLVIERKPLQQVSSLMTFCVTNLICQVHEQQTWIYQRLDSKPISLLQI